MEPTPAEPAAAALPLRARVAGLRGSGTASAAGLAAAMVAQQVLGLAFTIVFARLLGPAGYGSLASLLALTIILLVPGSALQVAAAREGTLGRLGRGGELAATLDRWMRHLLIGLVGLAVLSALAREPLAALVNVEQEWAAAAVPVTAALWLVLSVQRGLLQAAQAYLPVALSIALEGVGRIGVGLALYGLGLGVAGAYVGTFAAFACAAAVLFVVLRRRLGKPARETPRHPLRALARDASVPIVGLTLVAALQNVDVIMAKHALDKDAAGDYAAAAVAAKAIVWIAIGIGLWVLPEATRLAAAGHDPRRVLARGLAMIGALAVPVLAIFATVPDLVLRVAFGPKYEDGDVALLALGAAFALLAAAYVAVQFLLGLHRRGFVVLLALAAAAMPALLASVDTLRGFALTVLAIQAAAAATMLTLALRTRGRRRDAPAAVAA